MRDDRYQYQSWYVKLWRRRWYLWYYLKAIYLVLKWVMTGCHPAKWIEERIDTAGNIYVYNTEYDTRLSTLKYIWNDYSFANAQMKMKWYYTLAEVIQMNLLGEK